MEYFTTLPTPELIFEAGGLKKLPQILSNRDFRNIVVVTGGNSFINSLFWKELAASFDRAGISFNQYQSIGETSPEIVDKIIMELQGRNVDAIIAIGGGTVMDTGKAVSAMFCMSGSIVDYLEGVGTKVPTGKRKPLICVPTTSGTGSEATKNAVITRTGEDGFKKSLRHNGYIPDMAIIDPELITSCPVELTVATGLDAVTQLLESYVSIKSTPYTDNLALYGLRLAGSSLPKLAADGDNLDARGDMAYAAYLSGITLANAGLGVVHGAASVLGALRPIPHGVVCGTLLGSATEVIIEVLRDAGPSKESALKKYADASAALTGEKDGTMESLLSLLTDTLHNWTRDFEIAKLGDYGFTKEELITATPDIGVKNTPCTLSEADICDILISRL